MDEGNQLLCDFVEFLGRVEGLVYYDHLSTKAFEQVVEEVESDSGETVSVEYNNPFDTRGGYEIQQSLKSFAPEVEARCGISDNLINVPPFGSAELLTGLNLIFEKFF